MGSGVQGAQNKGLGIGNGNGTEDGEGDLPPAINS